MVVVEEQDACTPGTPDRNSAKASFETQRRNLDVPDSQQWIFLLAVILNAYRINKIESWLFLALSI